MRIKVLSSIFLMFTAFAGVRMQSVSPAEILKSGKMKDAVVSATQREIGYYDDEFERYYLDKYSVDAVITKKGFDSKGELVKAIVQLSAEVEKDDPYNHDSGIVDASCTVWLEKKSTKWSAKAECDFI
jgi:hypothetical protein